jgi:hypothetical protein
MFWGNAEWGHKLKSYLVYTAILKILALKKTLTRPRYPLLSHINSKTLITTAVSQDWFKNCFVPEVEKYSWGNNIPFNNLLIAHNVSAHLHGFHSNVEFMLVSANISPPAYGSGGHSQLWSPLPTNNIRSTDCNWTHLVDHTCTLVSGT